MRNVLCSAILLTLFAAPKTRADEQLSSDPRIHSGRLQNGVTWLYRQHDKPPGKMAMMIHVDSGSLNETDAQRGLAHFLEHMAFNGTEHFPPGELIKYFESIGMEFGADLNAFTGFDQTAYMLFLPDTTPEQVDRALLVLSDYAFRMSLTPEEIDQERGVILSELRAGMSAQQRIRDKFFEQVFAGMRISERLPIGIEDVIRNATRDDFLAYYRTWYRPEHVTLLVVGDAAPEPYLPLIEKNFGQYSAPVPAKPPKGPELKPFSQDRACIITDPEYARCEASLYGIRAGRPPVTTKAQARVELVDETGSWIIGRRLTERINAGKASYRSASVGIESLMNDAMLAEAEAVGTPENWEKMLSEIIIEVNRAREHGFLPGEFELCKRELLARAERAVEAEPSASARHLLMSYLRAVNDGEPILSAQQRLDLLAELLPTIKREEVNAAFASHFEPGAFTYVLTMPESPDVALPAADDVLAAARAAHARTTDPPEDIELTAGLLEDVPEPGTLIESSLDGALDITSGRLSNNVRLHYRFMDYEKDTITVTVALAGGQIEETDANAGITLAASQIVGRPATSRHSATAVQDILTGRKIQLGGGAQNDVFMLRLSGSPKDLEIGLELVHALLTDGRLEQTAFDNWKQRASQAYQMQSRLPQMAAIDTLFRMLTGDDPRRIVLLPPERINALSLEQVQAWIDRLFRSASIEVAIVGDMQFEEVMPLIETYLGSLPERPRDAARLAPLRTLNRPTGPVERSLSIETITPQGVGFTGFFGAHARDVADVRALDLAAKIADSRLNKRVREELGIVYSIGAFNAPEEAYYVPGLFVSGAPCEPNDAETLIKEIEAIFTALTADGPTDEEVEIARKQMQNDLDSELKQPSFWLGVLQTLDLHRRDLRDYRDVAGAYAAITKEQIHEALRRCNQPQRAFRIIVTPKAAETPAAPVPQPRVQP